MTSCGDTDGPEFTSKFRTFNVRLLFRVLTRARVSLPRGFPSLCEVFRKKCPQITEQLIKWLAGEFNITEFRILAVVHFYFSCATLDGAICQLPLIIENVFHIDARVTARPIMFDPIECRPHENKVMGLEVVGYRVPRPRACEQPRRHELPGPLHTDMNICGVVYKIPLTARGPSKLLSTSTSRHKSQSFNLPPPSRPIMMFPKLASL